MPTDKPRWWRRILSRLTTKVRRPRADQSAQDDDRQLVLSLSPSRIPSFKQLRYLPRLLTIQERRLIRLGLVLAGLSLCLLIGRILFRHVITVPTPGGSLTEAVVGTPQYLNPVLARPYSADTELTRLLFSGLLRVNERMEVVPDLAESVTPSADGKVYTVILRPNLKWSDGTEITSADILYTYETVADTSYQSPIQGLYTNMTVTAPDARTVVFSLTDVNYPFLRSLTLGILPAALWRDQTPQTFSLAELNVKPVGSGPYKFQSVTKDRSGNLRGFTFIRNENFAGLSPFIDKISVKVYPESIGALDALTSNAVDSLGGITTDNLAKAEGSRTVSQFAISQVTAVFFSQKTNPALKIKEVRQALAMVVDRPALIVSAFSGVGRPANSPLLPGQPGYASDIKQLPLDVAGANALLDQAGWKLADTGIRSKGKQELAFTLTTVDDPRYTTAAHTLAESWKAIGAKVEVKIVTADRLQKDVIRPRSYDAFLFGQISNTSASPYQFWHSSQQRDTGFALAVGFIKKADQDLDAAQKATTTDAYTAALRDFQTIIADEVPAIILVQSEYLYAHERSLRGFQSDRFAAAADRFDGVHHWYLKTRWGWK